MDSSPEPHEPDLQAPEPEPAPSPRSFPRRVLRWSFRGVLGFVLFVATYVGAAFVLGRVPVHGNWRSTPGGHAVYVWSNGVHADLVLPAVVGSRDLRVDYPLTSESRRASYVAFGWGDRGFYLEVPEWSDLTVSAALSATLIPSPTLMHVTHWYRAPEEGAACKRIFVSDEELELLLEWIDDRFVRGPDGTPRRLEGAGYPPQPGYVANNEFFEARGSYHLFNTCNDWTRRGLEHAGIRAPFWSPFESAILRQLEGR